MQLFAASCRQGLHFAAQNRQSLSDRIIKLPGRTNTQHEMQSVCARKGGA